MYLYVHVHVPAGYDRKSTTLYIYIHTKNGGL